MKQSKKNAQDLLDAITNGATPEEAGPSVEVPKPSRKKSTTWVPIVLGFVVIFGMAAAIFWRTWKGMGGAGLTGGQQAVNPAPQTLSPWQTQSWVRNEGMRADEGKNPEPPPPPPSFILKDPKNPDPDYTGKLTPEEEKALDDIRHGRNPNARQGANGGAGKAGNGSSPAPKEAHALVVDYSKYFDENGHLKSDKPAEKPEAPTETAKAALPLLPPPSSQPLPTPGPDNDERRTPTDTKGFTSWDEYNGQLYRVLEGSEVSTRLMNRVISSGQMTMPLVCEVVDDFWSHDMQWVLIPKGAKFLGDVAVVASQNQERAFVVFHALLYQDGFVVDLNQFGKVAGTDVTGDQGIRGQVNRHTFDLLMTAGALAAIGAISNVGVGSYGGYGGISFGTQLRLNLGSQLSQEAMQMLAQKLNRVPTFTLKERTFVTTRFPNSNVLLPDAAHHHVRFDL